MDLLCKVCDRSIIENEPEYKNYIARLHNKDDKGVYKKYVVNKINLDEVDKTLNDHITTYSKSLIFST